MKKMIVTAALMMMPLVVFADANKNKYLSALDAGSTYRTNAATDIAAYKGNSTIAVLWGTANDASYTGIVTVTHSTSSTGTYTTVTNLAGTAGTLSCTGITTNEIDTFAIDLGAVHRYLKLTHTGVAHATNSCAAVLVAPMKSE